MKKMGIEQAVRAKVVDEAGVQVVNRAGTRIAFIEANKSGKGKQGPTSEFEIMRGDLSRILYDRTKDKVKYVFGIYVTSLQQEDESVKVRFSNAKEDQFDLVVGADGLNSRTRRMALEPDAPDPFQPLGVYTSYFTIPMAQQEGNVNMATMYHAPGRRVLLTRRDNPHSMQVYLTSMSNGDRLEQALKGDVSEQKEAWAETFRGAGWQSSRLLEGMRTSDDFYALVNGQVKMDSWSRGRVVLLGDSAFCPSSISGMGTSAALVGAYVLAGEIAKHCQDASKDGLLAALAAYDDRLRPFIEKVQHVSPRFLRAAHPETQWGIWVLHSVVWVITALRLDKLISRYVSDDIGGWDLPEYPELSTQE
jgi:2-polyprenyl-6-methoxyphenol hydroxylase-like FAD-dependent oxidoreductase